MLQSKESEDSPQKKSNPNNTVRIDGNLGNNKEGRGRKRNAQESSDQALKGADRDLGTDSESEDKNNNQQAKKPAQQNSMTSSNNLNNGMGVNLAAQ